MFDWLFGREGEKPRGVRDIKEVEDIALISGAHHQAITALLIEKGIFTREELRKKAAEIAGLTEEELLRRVSDFSKK